MTEAHEIEVTCTFALSTKPTYRARDRRETTVGTVLELVMGYFEVHPEPNVEFYLVAHDERQPDSQTLGEVAGDADRVEFRLRKETTQG